MNEEGLKRKLQSVGVECFIKYFDLFSSGAPQAEILEILIKETTYTEKSCRSRASHGLGIFRSGNSIAALEIIINSSSKRVAESVKQQARQLLLTHKKDTDKETIDSQSKQERLSINAVGQAVKCDTTKIKGLWLKYNEYSNSLSMALGRTSNIVGEYGEYIAQRYYRGTLLSISEASADISTEDGTRYQVKSRKLKSESATQLSVIRSWDFDYLVVILFDLTGNIVKAIEAPVSVAKEYAVENTHQNGWVITTSKNFLNDERSIDITLELQLN